MLMRAGGGKFKGASFEREIGKQLSNWLTKGERGDLFARNVLSGGKFTNSQQKGKKEGVPGDLMAAHPLAYEFLSSFLIECKHYADLNWEAFIYDTKKTAFLWTVITKCRDEAKKSGLSYIIVAKQNRRPPMALMEKETYIFVQKSTRLLAPITMIHGVCVLPLGVLLRAKPKSVLALWVGARKHDTDG